MTDQRSRDRARRRDRELRQALFDTLWVRFQQEQRRDPVLQDLARRLRVFSLTRLGHLLTYQQGPAPTIGGGEMRWKPTVAGEQDTPYRFTVRRSTLDRYQEGPHPEAPLPFDTLSVFIVGHLPLVELSMLQIVDDHGPSSELTLTEAVDAIVSTFIEQAA